MQGRITLAPFAPTKCEMHRWHAPGCERERKAMQAVARSGKPAGYTWRLWHDPRGPAGARPVPTGPVRDWRYPIAAWKQALADANTAADATRRGRLYEAWLKRSRKEG